MALLLAPYNNAMRLGQGLVMRGSLQTRKLTLRSFNSYTQQICIDDAVTLDPSREANSLSNDGFTMADLKQAMRDAQEARAQEQSKQEAEDQKYTEDTTKWETEEAKLHKPVVPKSGLPDTSMIDDEMKEDEEKASLSDEERNEDQVEERKKAAGERASEAAKPDDIEASVSDRTASDLLKMKPVRRWAYEQTGRRAPSQIVTYGSRFIHKVSDVTDDMNISGSLSIKYNMIGGSGRGSFIDSNKLMESDLNFYISVKVINQTMSEKDRLVFNPLPEKDLKPEDFRQIYGDSFISGFLEGGELNAIVSIKVLNEEKKMDIAASAKVALTAGPVELDARGKVNIAKENLKANSETTIQVSWSGGGHLKNSEDEWDIETLVEVASRFPDLVAVTPQRTYAILTKYDALRSFQLHKPPSFTPLQYENATIYTNAMLDAYMDYKNIYTKLGQTLFGLESGVLEFFDDKQDDKTANQKALPSTQVPANLPEPTKAPELPQNPTDKQREEHRKDLVTYYIVNDKSQFPPTIAGLDLARRSVRNQMSRLVLEVDELTKDPRLATDLGRAEAFQTPSTFRTRIPNTRPKKAPRRTPLAIKKISLDAEDDDEDAPEPYAYTEDEKDPLDARSKELYARIVKLRPNIGKHLRMDRLQGQAEVKVYGLPTTPFNSLEFIGPDFIIQQVQSQMAEGGVCSLVVRYTNGMVMSQGNVKQSSTKCPTQTLNLNIQMGEKIIACTIEVGRKEGGSNPKQVTGLTLYTNRGQILNAWETRDTRITWDSQGTRMGMRFKDLAILDMDPKEMEQGYLKGFWGTSVTGPGPGEHDGLYALGPIWGDLGYDKLQ